MLGRGADKHPLHLRLRGTPERKPPIAVVVVHVHDECPLAADEERRRAVARPLDGFRERKTDLPDPREDAAAGCTFRATSWHD